MPAFDDAVTALMDAIGEGDSNAFLGADFDVILQGLGRLIRSRYGSLSREDVVDVVNEALLRFVAAVRDGRVDPTRRPAAYLTTVAINTATEVLRQRRSEELVGQEELERAARTEESLDALLARHDDRRAVRDLMQRAREAGEHDLADLIRCFRDLVASGEQPTLRELGTSLGISHTEVRRRLDRLAAL